MRRHVIAGLGLRVACLALATSPLAAQETVIGSVAAANPDVLGTPPQGETRKLQLGLDLISRERVETSSLGAGQFVFLDQTTLTVWPDSDLVLDEYVYDPDQGTGKMALSMTRGVLRFIGGRISKTQDVEIRTPNAVVAVRGGMAQIVVDGETTRAVHIAGQYTRILDLVLSRPMAVASATAGSGGAAFEGIASAEAVAGLYGAPAGEGDGGAGASAEAVDSAAEGSGIAETGSGDETAALDGPVSTLGEREHGVGGERDDVDVVERVLADLAVRDIVAPPEPPGEEPPGEEPPGEEPPGEEPPGEEPPGEEPPPPAPPYEPPQEDETRGGLGAVFAGGPPPAPGPAPGVTGARYDSSDDVSIIAPDGTTLDAPASAGVLFDAEASDRFTTVSRLETESGLVIRAATASGGVLGWPETAVFERTTGFSLGRPADVTVFVDPGDFLLTAFRNDDEAGVAQRLNFFGAPTESAFWSAPGQPIRRYDVSPELFRFAAAPTPPQLGDVFAEGDLGDLHLIPDPDGPVIPAGAAPGQAGDARWLMGWLAIEGEGPAQRSGLGVMTSFAAPTETGAPSVDGVFTYLDRPAANAAPGLGVAGYATLDDTAGATLYGPEGNYLVLGARLGLHSRWSGGEVREDWYGDTRLAGLDGLRADWREDRLSLAEPARPAVAAAGFEAERIGGYAAALGHTLAGAGETATVSAPWLLASRTGADLAFGFAPSKNAMAAELSGLAPAAGKAAPVTAVRLAFGGRGAESAMIDDRVYGARQSDAQAGALTGRVNAAASTAPGASPVPERRRMVGALASAGLVGDGGLFAREAEASGEPLRAPRYLDWGMWAAELSGEGAATAATGDDRRHRLSGGVYVGGVRSDLAEVLAMRGTGSYDGVAIGNVIERAPGGATAAYLDAGRFRMEYDFGRRRGEAELSGIAGQSLTADLAGRSGGAGPHYQGALEGFDGGPGRGALRGDFFRSGEDAAAATAGSFEFEAKAPTGNDAAVSGVFGADRKR